MDLRVTNLTCERAGLPVLEGVSFVVKAGEALMITGPNGIGKTTLLRVVAGLQGARAGQIAVEADNIAYAGHASGVKSTLSVAENLAFWASVYGTKSIDAALVAMNLTGLADRLAGHLSAGQKRRLDLARLLVSARQIWLMDEPGVSLDQASLQLLASVVAAHLAKGGMALIASHLDLALPNCRNLDLAQFKPQAGAGLAAFGGPFDEAFA